MSALLGAVVDGGDLFGVVWTSLAAGVGVAFAFALAIAGSTRAVDLGRDGRGAEALIFALLGILGALAVVGAVVAGVFVMTQK